MVGFVRCLKAGIQVYRLQWGMQSSLEAYEEITWGILGHLRHNRTIGRRSTKVKRMNSETTHVKVY